MFRSWTFFSLYGSAGVEQRHFVHNALNILVNESFLRDQQGVQSLEVVQKFYQIIKEPMRKETMVKKDLNSFCPAGKFKLDNQAVIILVYEDSETNDDYYHAVRVSVDLCFNGMYRVDILTKGLKSGHPGHSHSKKDKQEVE